MCVHVVPSARALARAGFYRLVALGHGYPSPDLLREFGRVLGHLRTGEPGTAEFQGLLEALADALASAGVGQGPDGSAGSREQAGAEALQAEFTRLFDRTVACTPYESDNVGGMRAFTKSRDLADVNGFYKAFGLELGPEAAEMADHIRVELEFMAALALKEAYFREEAADEALEVTIDAQRSFLRDHLGRWVPAFCDRLENVGDHPFYAALAGATRAVVAVDLTALAVEPLAVDPLASPASGRNAPDALAGDSLECPRA